MSTKNKTKQDLYDLLCNLRVSHEFRLGDTAVHVTHWLYVGASVHADEIDQ